MEPPSEPFINQRSSLWVLPVQIGNYPGEFSVLAFNATHARKLLIKAIKQRQYPISLEPIREKTFPGAPGLQGIRYKWNRTICGPNFEGTDIQKYDSLLELAENAFIKRVPERVFFVSALEE